MENLISFISGPIWTNAFVVFCPFTREAAIIDPAAGSAEPCFDFLKKNQLELKSIFLTHSHWDHIADVALIKEHYPSVKVFVHALDRFNLENPGSDKLFALIPINSSKADFFIEDKQQLSIGKRVFEAIHTPGHTPGCVCFYEKGSNILFTGDVLFKGFIGNTNFPSSQPHLMADSMAKLAALPDTTIVYPGHGPVTSIGVEKKHLLLSLSSK